MLRLARQQGMAWQRGPAVCFAPNTAEHIIAEQAARAAQRPQRVGLDAFQFDDSDRWTTTALSGSGLGQGDPTTITWSIVPDGTDIDGFIGEPDSPSNLIAWLDGIYGFVPGPDLQNKNWFPLFEQVFQRWGDLTGNNYVYEPNDDGGRWRALGPFNVSIASGEAGVRGDVRIAGHFIDDNSGVLAYNFFPNVGDMVLDTADNFFNTTSNNSLRLRNVLAHEHGHGIGLSHVCPANATKLMEPFVSTAYDGPQHDDILAGNRGYGDRLESNDTDTTATNLGAPSDGTTVVVDDVSIDDSSDTDWYSVTLPADKSINVTVRPIGFSYLSGAQNSNGSCSAGSSFNSLIGNDLGFEVLAPNGTTVLATVDATAAGVTEEILQLDLLNGAGAYFVRVFGNDTEAQMYQLEVAVEVFPPPPNDTCVDAICLDDGVPFLDTTQGATGTDVTSCATNDTLDAWFAYTPTASGSVTFSLCGSSFDTSLAVFDACGGTELACNDDSCSTQSELTMPLAVGSTYWIRVSGAQGTFGDYSLTVTGSGSTCSGCIPPVDPANPVPADAADDVPVDDDLVWNGGPPAPVVAPASYPPAPSGPALTNYRLSASRKTTITQHPAPDQAVSAVSGCLIVNGDFETGDLSGWTVTSTGAGTFAINDGTYIPVSADGPLPACQGTYSAVSDQAGTSTSTIYQDVALPFALDSATLRWTDMIRNHHSVFVDPNQEFRVEVRDPADDSVLAALFSTNPGDPLFSGCTDRNADISAYIGQTIRVAFTEQDSFDFFNVHIDDVCIDTTACTPTYDVFLDTFSPPTTLVCDDATNPVCTPGTLDPNTTYYWQAVATTCCGTTAGPIWSFTTCPAAPQLTYVCAPGLSADPSCFIFPQSAAVDLTEFKIGLDVASQLVSTVSITSTGGAAPTAVTAITPTGQGDEHTITLDAPLPQQHWTTIVVRVGTACGTETDLCIRAGRLPADINQDGMVGLSDASAFVSEFNGAMRPCLVDSNHDDAVGLADVSDWANNFSGNAGLGIPQANGTFLPPKPVCP